MGKLLEQYQAEYNSAICADIVKKDKKPNYIVKPEVWITFKYMTDNNINPWDPGFPDFIDKTILVDPALGAVIAAGLDSIAESMGGR